MKYKILFFLLFSSVAFGQKSIQYTPYTQGTGIAPHFSTLRMSDRGIDSAWYVLGQHGTISGLQIANAILFNGGYKQVTWSDPLGDRTGAFKIVPANSSGYFLRDDATWSVGPVGPKGDTGPQGIQGVKGDTGVQGPKGPGRAVLPIDSGGTSATTATGALSALLPSQSGQSGNVLGTNGTNTSWVSSGGGSSLWGEITYDTILPTSTPITDLVPADPSGVIDTIFLVQPHGVSVALYDSAGTNADTERAIIDGFLNGVRDTFTTINLPNNTYDTTVSNDAGAWDSIVSVTYYGDSGDVVQLIVNSGYGQWIGLGVDLSIDPVVIQMNDGASATFIPAFGRGHHFTVAQNATHSGRFYFTKQ